MNRLIFLFIGLLLTQTISAQVRLEATLGGIEDDTPVLIYEMRDGNQKVPILEIDVHDEKIIAQLPKVEFQTLNFMSVEGVNDELLFINENKDLEIIVNTQDVPSSIVKAGKANQLFRDYTDQLFAMNREMLEMSRKYSREQMRQDEVRKEVSALQHDVLNRNQRNFERMISKNPAQLPSLLILSDMMSAPNANVGTLKKLFFELSDEVKNTFLGQQIGATLREVKGAFVGDTAPEFKVLTPEGSYFSLSDIKKQKGEYVLVQFWASWCPYCMESLPGLVEVYDKFSSKGLKIIGVALDENKQDWTKAISNLQMVWPQISNLKHWEDPIAMDYGVNSIPTNYLIDNKGKVIGVKLTNDELETLLKKLLD